MKKVLFTKNTKIENDTYYYYDKNILEYFKEDTISLDNKEYFCSSTKYSNYHDTCIYINNKENVVLDFNGATLFLNGPLSPIIIANSRNIEIKNVNVKYDRAFHTEMELVEKGDGYLKLKVKDGFPYKVEDGMFIPYSKYFEDRTLLNTYVFLQEFDKETRKGLSWPVVLVGNKDLDKCKLPWGDEACAMLAYDEDGYLVLKGKNIPPYNVGSILVLCQNNRDISNLTIFNSEDIKITNYRIVNGLGMGLLPIYSKNITIDGLKFIYDELSSGIISNTADGIHAVACKGDFIIKDSIITGTIDDAVNFHSNFYLYDKSENNILYAVCPGQSDTFKIFDVGDEIAIYKGHTMEESDRAKIVSIEENGKNYKFVLNKNINEVEKDSLIENLSAQVNIYITNSFFGKANTHLRFQTRGKVVMDSCKTEMDLLFTGDTNFWYESSPVNNVVFKNIIFDLDKYGVVSIPEFKSSINALYYHKNILVENCLFKSNDALYMRFTDDIKFYNNKNIKNEPFNIRLDQCGNFDTNDNCNVERVIEKGSRDE